MAAAYGKGNAMRGAAFAPPIGVRLWRIAGARGGELCPDARDVVRELTPRAPG
jgi:hypothetical protein